MLVLVASAVFGSVIALGRCRWRHPDGPRVIRRLSARDTRDQRITALTGREREVLALVARGLANSAIRTGLVLVDDTHRRVRAVPAHLDQ